MREAAEKNVYTLKIPKVSPGASVFERPFLRGLGLFQTSCYCRAKMVRLQHDLVSDVEFNLIE